MDIIHIVILVVLLGLATLDLVVGVANDAVNFLNSSIGSKVVPLWVILTVASAGVLLGSLFSTGMMEIARSGVFHPGMFTFPQIMMLFLAVMVTDVILLDVFNTFGLPTSTTVSLIFELLGAAVAVALFNIWQTNSGSLIDYINSDKALAIISGILVSVVIAFVFGSIIMWFSRLAFSFRYAKTFKYFGAIWGGIALTAISYFAIFKGLKNTTLLSKETFQYIHDNIAIIAIYVFGGWAIFMALLQFIFKVNILKIIILAGTAALALSFAGNDLVNFIGVFMAALSSFQIASDFVASGGSVDNLMMGGLSEPVHVDWRFLLGAGIIMVLALWFSKKAKNVTKTEVNLSRQGEGIERFSSVGPSRSLVRYAVNFNKAIEKVTPKVVTSFIDNRFKPLPTEERGDNSFDLIRASVNLMVSALLISIGTDLKLPLSTTYVTFMVAMGSSLADRAWGRESAVYRITGVLTVISGWFLTAFIAFTVAAVVAFLLMLGGIYAVVGFIGLVIFMSIQFTRIHKKRESKEAMMEENMMSDEHDVVLSCTKRIEETVSSIIYIYQGVLDGVLKEDRKSLSKLYKMADELHGNSKHFRTFEVLPTLQRLDQNSLDTGQYFVQVVDYTYEIAVSLRYITEQSYDFINNTHEGFVFEQIEDLKQLGNEFVTSFNMYNKMIKSNNYAELETIKERRAEILDLYSELVKKQIKRTKAKVNGTRNSILYLNILNETKVIAMKSANLMRAQMNLYNSDDYNKISKSL